MPDVEQMVRRQRVLADFGGFALHSESLDEVLTEAGATHEIAVVDQPAFRDALWLKDA